MKKILFLSALLCLTLIVVTVAPLPLLAKSDSLIKPEKAEKSNMGEVKRSEGGVQVQTATVGKVEKVSGNTIVIKDKKQNKSDAVIEKDTMMLGKNNKPIKLNQVKVEDKVAFISSDSAKRKKVIKVFVKDASSSAQTKRRAVQGVIIAINGPIITIAHQIQRDRTNQVLINDQTVIKSKSSSEASGSAVLQVGLRVVVIGDLNEIGQLVAKRVHVIPGKAKGIFKKYPLASASATPTSSPSATPTVTLEPSPTIEASPTATLSP